MKIAIMGTYFRKNSLVKAVDCLNKKNALSKKLHNQEWYTIIEFPNGYLVINKTQLA